MNLEDMVKRLCRSGHEITPQRSVIIKTMLESPELLTPSALFEKYGKQLLFYHPGSSSGFLQKMS
jgi:Fe2+ or Zn2+ uptake regulation protein